ncbi:hypothetical protein CRG98_031156, partial [Punica granatum]
MNSGEEYPQAKILWYTLPSNDQFLSPKIHPLRHCIAPPPDFSSPIARKSSSSSPQFHSSR